MTYADDYDLRSAANVSLTKIANAVDGLLATVGTPVTYSSVINTTSTSFTTMTGLSISVSVADGEIVLLGASVSLSHGTQNEVVKVRLYEDSTALAVQQSYTSHRANTGGEDETAALIWVVAAPSVGSHTYTVKWAVDNGTAYSRWGMFSALALQAS